MWLVVGRSDKKLIYFSLTEFAHLDMLQQDTSTLNPSGRCCSNVHQYFISCIYAILSQLSRSSDFVFWRLLFGFCSWECTSDSHCWVYTRHNYPHSLFTLLTQGRQSGWSSCSQSNWYDHVLGVCRPRTAYSTTLIAVVSLLTYCIVSVCGIALYSSSPPSLPTYVSACLYACVFVWA